MNAIKQLEELQAFGGQRITEGLPVEKIRQFLALDPRLGEAIDEAQRAHTSLRAEFEAQLRLPEADLIEVIQAPFINFYPTEQRNPYVSLAASGPWLVTTHGAVLHDSGGYGMLGFGHAPKAIAKALGGTPVMANIMTANFNQLRLAARLDREIGHSRARGERCFAKYICMNSGSEAVSVAVRISDINAKTMTDPGGRHAGKKVMFLALKGGFHGRTDRPAQASSSTLKNYSVLASFRSLKNLHTIEPNDVHALHEAFAWADREGVFFECLLMEPVMGEGDPGKAVTPEFYKLARELTAKTGTLLVVDSIQAGLRAQGCLSICDYPGFQELPAPDMESYSKALNAGQYPLSILALREETAKLYVRGVYGNTMTTNPRALEVACAVLDAITPELRRNIQDRGKEIVNKFEALAKEFPDVITGVRGTGLLVAAHISPDAFAVVGFGQLEEYLRRHGIGVIHGGANALRYTPHFAITSAEIDLIVDSMRHAFKFGPRKKQAISG